MDEMTHSIYQSSTLSFDVGINGNEMYKRKALEYVISQCMANGQTSEELAEQKDFWQRSLQRTHGFPQKKQKLAFRQFPCLWEECRASFENEADCILHMRDHATKSQNSDSSESTIGSPLWLDYSSGNSAESNFDSDGSELSPPSTATSRSSSRTRNYETISTKMNPHNSSPTSNGPHAASKHHVPISCSQQGSLGTFAAPRSVPEKCVATSPICSNSKASEVRKVKVCDGNHAYSQSCGRGDFGPGDVNNNQSPFPSSGISSGRSQPTAPSVAETDNPSDNNSSSQSQTSSTVSDSSTGEKGDDETQSEDQLEDLVKNHVMRADPEVAELFLRAVDGQLEIASSDNIEQLDDLTGLSLLHLLELPRCSSTGGFSSFTSHAPSSSSGSSSSSSSSSDRGAAILTSSNGLRLGSAGVATNRGSPGTDGGPSQILKGQKTSTKSGSSQSAKVQLLRCIHNALIPEVFCVNHETQDRFRACAGPGWNSIQHYKEHIQSHHTKNIKKASSLQCSDCQDKFQNQEELKSHKLDVDCSIRCPDCLETFDAKAKRTDHQKEQHPEDETDLAFREIDEHMWKRIKDNLKAYLDVVKKGTKGKGRSDPELDRWVDANTTRYMIGRPSKTNPKLELGQWYTIFKTVAPSAEILSHPFYEYPAPGQPPRSDFIEERIIFINDTVVESRIQAHGPPPTDIQPQKDWYRGVLRESLQIAAHTVYNPRKRAASPRLQTNESKLIKEPSESVALTQAYGVSTMPASHDSPISFLPNVSHEMNFQQQQQPHLQNSQQQTTMEARLQHGMAEGSSVIGDMAFSWIDAQTDMPDGTAQPMHSDYNFEFGQSLHMEFPYQQYDPLANPKFPVGWPGQGQHRRR